MKPTSDIVEELRLYNRWRRGDEAITAIDPTTLGKLIDDAADRIEHLFASGIHTCHDDCKRPVCVLRRERDKALADLAALRARVAEQDERIGWLETQREQECQQKEAALKESEICLLETKETKQRNAEREHQLKSEIEARNGWWDHCKAAEQRNAELVAALTTATNELQRATVVTDGHPSVSHNLMLHLREVIARAESAAPAKHPDTERLDWLAGTTNGVSFAFGSGKPIVSQGAAFPQFTGEDLRAAIDAARKQGGTP